MDREALTQKAQAVGARLFEKGMTVAVAESCTGGLVGAALTDVAGSSAYFLGGSISYANQEKTRALGVDPALITQHGAVSREVAEAMAEGIRSRTGASIAVSITGVAGPGGGTIEKPVGTVWIAVCDARGVSAELKSFGGKSRREVRHASVLAALDLLQRRLDATP